jgi:hypothetical protein
MRVGDNGLRELIDLAALGPWQLLANDGCDMVAGKFVDGSVQLPPLSLTCGGNWTLLVLSVCCDVKVLRPSQSAQSTLQRNASAPIFRRVTLRSIYRASILLCPACELRAVRIARRDVLTTLSQALKSKGAANRGGCMGMEVSRCGAGKEEQDLPLGQCPSVSLE